MAILHLSAVLACVLLSVSAVNYQRTVVAIARPTRYGEYVFLRGGDASGNPIPIINNMTTANTQSVYAKTSKGDNLLNWGGAEDHQGTFTTEQGRTFAAQGTPMMWTTNDRTQRANVETDGHGFAALNDIGEHLWMVDFYMDCDSTDNGMFDFKGYIADMHTGDMASQYEKHAIGQDMCIIDGRETSTPGDIKNHRGKCGYFNCVMWDSNFCMANNMDIIAQVYRQGWVEGEVQQPMQ